MPVWGAADRRRIAAAELGWATSSSGLALTKRALTLASCPSQDLSDKSWT